VVIYSEQRKKDYSNIAISLGTIRSVNFRLENFNTFCVLNLI